MRSVAENTKKNGQDLRSRKSRKNRRRYNMKKVIITTLAIVFSLSIFAQNSPTPYQKKQLELSKKYFQIFYGYRMTMADEIFYNQLEQGGNAREFLLALGIMGYAMNNTEAQVKRILTQMKNEYDQAEKLKNATDFRLEKERDLRAAQEAYEKTDIGAIRKNIKSAFEKWNLKGEFEKEADFAKRLQSLSQKIFDDICLEEITKRIKNKDMSYWKKKLLPYNSENETFTILFKINDISWQSNINISIAQAEKFKSKFSNLRIKIGTYDWCFKENSLCPTLVTLENRDTEYQFYISLQNESEITQSFDNLDINNQYLSGYVFKFSKAKFIAEQKERDAKFIVEQQERHNEYRKNGKLFVSETEFDSFYTKGKNIYQSEVEKKTILKYFSDNTKYIESMDFQKEARKIIGSASILRYTETHTNYSGINADGKTILSAIRKSQDKPYYSHILNFAIETNKKLKKEWSKNGQFFESKSDFYSAFLSDKYKQILKDKKKKK